MASFPDGSPCGYFGAALARTLRAVGWLSDGSPFPQGELEVAARDRLLEQCGAPWTPMSMLFMGVHVCELCTHEQAFAHGDGRPQGVASRNLLVPATGGDQVWVAPDCLDHYVVVHGYLPPEGFVRDLLACPPMASDDYFARLGACGDSAWQQLVGRERDAP